MQGRKYQLGLLLLLAWLSPVAMADPPEAPAVRQAASPKFLIYSIDEDAELASSLHRVLRGSDKVERILKANSLEKAAASEAGVLVLVMPRNASPRVDAATRAALKKRKIVGIGAGAAHLFGQLGLEISFDHCETFGASPPDIYISNSTLLGKPKLTTAAKILEPTADVKSAKERFDSFGLFIPADSPKTSTVDVLARFTGDSNYAPIVRQGQCVLIGVPAPASQWSEAYTGLIRDTAQTLAERSSQALSEVD